MLDDANIEKETEVGVFSNLLLLLLGLLFHVREGPCQRFIPGTAATVSRSELCLLLVYCFSHTRRPVPVVARDALGH